MPHKYIASISSLTSLLLVAICFSARAEEPSLIDLPLESLLTMQVSSASKFSQSISEAPSAVQVITAGDIRQHGWRTLEEALNSLPGIYTNQDKSYGFLGARGFLVPGDYNTRFLLLLDGQRINDNVYGQAMFGQEFALDMGLIARIEYVPGPGSSLYGANAMFGVINVITQKSDELPKQKASVAITQDGWREGRALINRKTENGLGLTASVSRGVKQGKDLFYDYAGGGQTSGLDQHQYSRGFARINKDGFTLTAWANQRVVRPSSAPFQTNFNDPAIRIEDSSAHIVAKYEKSLNDDLNVDGRLAHSQMTYFADQPFNDTLQGNYINRDETDGRWWLGEARLLYTGITNHKFVVGSEWQSDTHNVQQNYDVNINLGNTPIYTSNETKTIGIYAQDDWTIREGWRLNLGLRADHVSNHNTQASPRLGLIWDVRDNTTFKLLGGQAYRRPNAYETKYADGTFYLENPLLQPETIRNLEAVIDQKLGRGQTLVVSIFNYQLKNLIQQVTEPISGLLQYQNQPSITANGVETTYRLNADDGTHFTTSLALNHTRDAMGQLVLNSPRWIAKANGSKPLGAWLFGAEINVIGKRELDWKGTGTREVLGTQWLGNINLIAPKWIPHLETQLRITNVFDRKVVDPASGDSTFPTTQRDGRLWQLGASYEF